MSVSLLEQSFDRSRENDLAAFRAAQMLAGGGSDPFGPVPNEFPTYRGCFEYMPKALVPAALQAAAKAPHGSIEISLKRPTVDERLAGKPDTLASDDPAWWVGVARTAGIPVVRYIVGVTTSHLAITW